jgi:hypothetical protein
MTYQINPQKMKRERDCKTEERGERKKKKREKMERIDPPPPLPGECISTLPTTTGITT